MVVALALLDSRDLHEFLRVLFACSEQRLSDLAFDAEVGRESDQVSPSLWNPLTSHRLREKSGAGP